MDADLRRELDGCINDLRAAANLLTEAAGILDGAVQGVGALAVSEKMRHYADRYSAAATRLGNVR